MTGSVPGAGLSGDASAALPGRRPMAVVAELGVRLGSALVLMAGALGTARAGGHPFTLFWLAAALAVLWEWERMIGGERRSARFAIGGLALAAAAPLAAGGLLTPALLVLALGAALLAWRAAEGGRLFAAGGLGYAGCLIVSVGLLRHSFPFGMEAMLWLFAVVWGTDVMALVGGRLIGGPRLAPAISPAKTWSGCIVGVVAGALLGVAVTPYPGRLGIAFALGLVGGAVAQAGDLFESALKRRFGVKDSGSVIPGHGGVMDRLDGFIAAATFAACLGVWRLGTDAAGAGLLRW